MYILWHSTGSDISEWSFDTPGDAGILKYFDVTEGRDSTAIPRQVPHTFLRGPSLQVFSIVDRPNRLLYGSIHERKPPSLQ